MAHPTTMTPRSWFVDAAESAVEGSLVGLCQSQASPPLKLLRPFPEVKVALRGNLDPSDSGNKVALVSGGGSGHEPGQVGYVGEGCLSAAVCGDVFASPSAEAVYRAIKATTGAAGCLLIVLNYTGDRLNFGLAAERAKRELGLEVEICFVGEDVALSELKTGRRGLAGTVLVHKICGAAARAGRSLPELKALADRVASRMGTIGVSLTACNIPGQPPSSRIGPGEMEVGLGIHGEPGREKIAVPDRPAERVAALMCDAVARGNEYVSCAPGDRVVLLVNNLGAATPIEMGLVARHAIAHCRRVLGLSVSRAIVGAFKTSLDMVGVSLTILKVGGDGCEDLLPLLDEPTEAPAWPKATHRDPLHESDIFLPEEASGAGARSSKDADGLPPISEEGRAAAKAAILGACAALVDCQEEVDALDRLAGGKRSPLSVFALPSSLSDLFLCACVILSFSDGDCGSTLRKGAEGIHKDLDTSFDFTSWSSLAGSVAHSVLVHMGGTSGAIYNIFFTAASTRLATNT